MQFSGGLHQKRLRTKKAHPRVCFVCFESTRFRREQVSQGPGLADTACGTALQANQGFVGITGRRGSVV